MRALSRRFHRGQKFELDDTETGSAITVSGNITR
jgi:hypothetical protein